MVCLGSSWDFLDNYQKLDRQSCHKTRLYIGTRRSRGPTLTVPSPVPLFYIDVGILGKSTLRIPFMTLEKKFKYCKSTF